MRGMTSKALLEYLAKERIPAAEEVREQLEEARKLQGSSPKALQDAAIVRQTNEGRRTYQTILTAPAYDGEDGPSKVSNRRKAEIF